ncbi:homeobox-leucine zipper protein HAT22 [Ziziphus jujuba]|uniref:Homeobox-leucine zipper protein HAT22 n=1 Tax=Ziziphus jujuba TaxID=326968 RepID=A0A6P4AAE9_ZIZJJ|nr:homeobox-leucine zipper protein HAT22 [Ziziphus jujuba]
MDLDDGCEIGLGLGLVSRNFQQYSDDHHHQNKKRQLSLKYDHLVPSLTLGPSPKAYQPAAAPKIEPSTRVGPYAGESAADLQPQASSFSGVSSFSNSSSVKRDRDLAGEEVEAEAEVERVSSRISITDQEDEEGSPRKKLRLTKEQSATLEDSFKKHTTLNPKQKQELARQLNLRPRQVEVWFQNRRARTKLKQTEADCELLKKCCETLTEENNRLKKELQELKASKLTPPVYMHLPTATLSMCPSCERICAGSTGGGGGDDGTSSAPFSIGGKPHFFSPFTHPSAAC